MIVLGAGQLFIKGPDGQDQLLGNCGPLRLNVGETSELRMSPFGVHPGDPYVERIWWELTRHVDLRRPSARKHAAKLRRYYRRALGKR